MWTYLSNHVVQVSRGAGHMNGAILGAQAECQYNLEVRWGRNYHK
jgi:hypothetical protein